MAKKQTKLRKALNDKVELLIVPSNTSLRATESYMTIKKRIMDNQKFIEVTTRQRQKHLINKNNIAQVNIIS